MFTCLRYIFSVVLVGQSLAHMKLVNPPARNSMEIKKMFNLPWTFVVDYDLKAPLGMEIANVKPRTFPCVGWKKGLISANYVAGKYAEVEIGGSTDHNGGHCQFSISYDEKIFIAIGNIYNDCPIKGNRKFKIKIPENAPDGNAVLAWTWISRTGLNGEFFMNCADINIQGKKNGFIVGHDILVRKILPGPTYFEIPKDKSSAFFPENFGKDYNIENYSNTPIYNLTRSGSVLLKKNHLEALEYKSEEKVTTNVHLKGKSPKIVKNETEPKISVNSESTNFKNQPKQSYTPPITSKKEPNPSCKHGEMLCVGLYKFSICSYGMLYIQDVSPGTECNLVLGLNK